ncbi:MAG: transposase [Candidatus Sumerlaeaceae bacterium]
MDDPEELKNAYPGWNSRGYLPHFDDGLKFQFLTWRLADSLPARALERLSNEPPTPEGEANYRRRLEQWLDAGHGSCVLRDPAVAGIVQGACFYFAGERYELHAWCIMPNHVHVLIHTIAPFTIVQIEHSWKSYTAHEINKALKRSGKLWQKDGWDRFIRDEKHYLRTVEYIEENPVKAKLCRGSSEWLWSSANAAAKEALHARGTRALPASLSIDDRKSR